MNTIEQKMIHIHAPSGSHTLQNNVCSTCGVSQWMLGHHAMYYSSDWVCLTCGERYNDDGRAERPFERGWRKKSLDKAFKTLKDMLEIRHVEWLKAEIASDGKVWKVETVTPEDERFLMDGNMFGVLYEQ